MKISSHTFTGASLRPLLAGAGISMLLASLGSAATVTNGTFTNGTGQDLPGVLTLLGAATDSGPVALGTSGWSGRALGTTAVVVVPVAGLRPEVGVTTGVSGAGVINYGLGAGLGDLVGLELPEATLWQPLAGTPLVAGVTYQVTVDVTTTSLLTLNALSANGFGIGITSGATTTNPGTNVFSSLTASPSLVSLSVLGVNTQQLSLTFVAPVGGITNAGVEIFGGRGNQGISAALLNSYSVDNVTLTAIPEPSAALLLGGAACALAARRRR